MNAISTSGPLFDSPTSSLHGVVRGPSRVTGLDGVEVVWRNVVLSDDTFHGVNLYAAARRWCACVTDTAFVRIEALGSAGHLVSVLRFVGADRGELVTVCLRAGDEVAARSLQSALLDVESVVVLGHALEVLDGHLPFASRIVERRSALSIRVHEYGMLQALRDEAWMTARRVRGHVNIADALEMAWFVDRAESEVFSLVALAKKSPSLH